MWGLSGRGAPRHLRGEGLQAHLLTAGYGRNTHSFPSLKRPCEWGPYDVEGVEPAPITPAVISPIPESNEGTVHR